MRSTTIVALLVSLNHAGAVAVPVEQQDRLHVREAALFDQPNIRNPHLVERELEERQIKTTSMPLNPGPPRTTTTTTTTANARATQTINVTGMTYINAMLQSHNVHRPNHTEANLVWNTALANTAAKIASSCNYAHDTTTDGGGYGQNIGAGAAGNAAAGLITNLMYNGEINNFPQPYGRDSIDMTNFGTWGHYSQLVWADTTDVGCATVYCPQGLKNAGSGIPPYFTVCNYKPPGNYLGQFSKVKAPQGGNTYVVIGS